MAARKASFPLLEPNLARRFGLKRLFKNTPILQDWLDATGSLSAADEAILLESQEKLIENADSWNEEELKMQFISFIMFLARFSNTFRTYYDREISETIDGEFLLCKANMMLSKGIGEWIETPYFFMHEYSDRRGGNENDADDIIGQMIGGMLIGQAKNNDEKPIYGCYVQGRYWFFSVLDAKQYVISEGFDSSKQHDAHQIIFILRKLNQIILTQMTDL